MTTTLDPIQQMEQIAHRAEAEREADEAMRTARARMLLSPKSQMIFFGRLSMSLTLLPKWEIDTACTDGKSLWYNPDFVLSLSEAERIGLVAHEVLHPAYDHHHRRNGRDAENWNIAADLAINPVLKDAGLTLPKCGVFPGEGQYKKHPHEASAEQHYDLLPPGKGQGKGKGPGFGEVIDDPGGDAPDGSKGIDAVAIAQAGNAARQRGTLPGALDRLVGAVTEAKKDWREELADFTIRSIDAKDDYSWARPNVRYLQQGLYLPAMQSESIGRVILAIDCSGSTSSYLEIFAAQINAILEARPCSVAIIYCDAQVHRVDEWTPGDGPIEFTTFPGGGGTDHAPVWEWLQENAGEEVCCIALTDGYTNWGTGIDGLATLWAIVPGGATNAPFGRVIEITEED